MARGWPFAASSTGQNENDHPPDIAPQSPLHSSLWSCAISEANWAVCSCLQCDWLAQMDPCQIQSSVLLPALHFLFPSSQGPDYLNSYFAAISWVASSCSARHVIAHSACSSGLDRYAQCWYWSLLLSGTAYRCSSLQLDAFGLHDGRATFNSFLILLFININIYFHFNYFELLLQCLINLQPHDQISNSMNLKGHIICHHQNLSHYRNLRSLRFGGLNHSGCQFDWTAWLIWFWVWWCWTSCDDSYLHIFPSILDHPFCALFWNSTGSYFDFGSPRAGLLQHVFYPASISGLTFAAWRKSGRERLQIGYLAMGL